MRSMSKYTIANVRVATPPLRMKEGAHLQPVNHSKYAPVQAMCAIAAKRCQT